MHQHSQRHPAGKFPLGREARGFNLDLKCCEEDRVNPLSLGAFNGSRQLPEIPAVAARGADSKQGTSQPS